MPTKVSLHLNPAQARCLEQYRCFVGLLAKDDSIPVGVPVSVFIGETEAVPPIEMIAVALQEGENEGSDLYIFARREDTRQI